MVVRLSGWDRATNWRRTVEFQLEAVATVGLEQRRVLEELIDHRAVGIGTHDGARRPNRRRVGTMLGRGVDGKQFWAVPSGRASQPVLVLDQTHGEFDRVVLMVHDPAAVAAEIERTLGGDDAGRT